MRGMTSDASSLVARLAALGTTLGAVLLLAGCGQKGPLTLPVQPPAGSASGAGAPR